MKRKIASMLILSILTGTITVRAQEEDPLSETYIIKHGGGEELVTFTTNPVKIDIYKYYKAFEQYPCDTLIKVLTWSESDYPYSYDLAIADLDKDKTDEIIAVWADNDQVEIAVLQIDPARLSVDTANALSKVIRLSKTSPAVYDPPEWNVEPGVFVSPANLDADSLNEFIVSYWASDQKLEITAYDVDDSLNITELSSIRDQELSMPPLIELCEDFIYTYQMAGADLNGDGRDEILITGREARDPEGWNIFARVYAYNEDTDTLEAKVKEYVYTQPDPGYDMGYLNIGCGHFHNTETEDAVIGIFEYHPQACEINANDTIANILIPIKSDAQLTSLTVGEPVYQRKDTIPDMCYYNRSGTLAAADMNNDGLDELVSAFSFNGELPVCKIYQGEESLGFSLYADLDGLAQEYYSIIPVGNFLKDSLEGDGLQEMIITFPRSWSSNYTRMYQVKILPDGSFEGLELVYTNEKGLPDVGFIKHETLLAGNMDHDIRIGKPKRYTVTEILQPLVILNAPPIHFDVFDNQGYDVCESFNDHECQFVAQYVKETQQSTEVRTEVNRDWSMSTTLSGGFSYWGLSVSAHLTEEYGKKFSKVDGSSRTVTVGFEIDATVDDQIYATVMDYDLWEYPVYGADKLVGHVLVVDPQIVKNSWFDSKSWKGYSYIPNHEVGNILSYRRYPLLSDNPMLAEKIKGDYGLETSFLLSGNSSYDWYLNFTDFTENQATTTKEYTRDWGVSVSYWGSGFSMNGHYHSENINTQRTTVESGINLNVHLDAVDMSLGETRYDVTPYAYWASNGALVIDYAVSPELAGPGGEDTWWDTHYGYLPDPAFILPWRYDPEKGHAISEDKRYQTNDILFKPEDPSAGDTISIQARVHNFSLLPTPGPVGVRFYVGNPNDGGTLITGINGESEVFTDGLIPPRGRMEVKLLWKIPEDLPAFPRIYAEIDGNDELTEIHENNNRSWNILQKTTGTVISEAIEDNIQQDFRFANNYPNPFRGSTRIHFSLATPEHVRIDVFNLMGQKVSTLVGRSMIAGDHEVEFNGESLPPGIYLCIIKAGKYQQVLKMVRYR